ncbi:MAG: hypothetical protein MRY57_03150 [Candidatus Pacebacteria bacterium]|nr:hypothetical protein [Candidatus Paceibacterota bacterium]
MTEISKKARADYGGRWPDIDTKPYVGKMPPSPSKREQVKKNLDFKKLGEVLAESNSDYLTSSLGDRKERSRMRAVESIFMTQKEHDHDNANQQKMFNKLNRLIQKKRTEKGNFNTKKALKKLNTMYQKSMPWWPTKQEIVFRTAELIVENQ